MVAVTDSTGVDFEQDLAYAGLEHGHAFDLKRLVFAGDDGCLEGLWEVGGCAHVGEWRRDVV